MTLADQECIDQQPMADVNEKKKRVLLVPGYVYGKAYERCMRIGYGCTTEKFEEGLAIIMHELQHWQGDQA